MASLKELRNRIASVKATQKITKAMQTTSLKVLRFIKRTLLGSWDQQNLEKLK